jgi:hypothetical protein
MRRWRLLHSMLHGDTLGATWLGTMYGAACTYCLHPAATLLDTPDCLPSGSGALGNPAADLIGVAAREGSAR